MIRFFRKKSKYDKLNSEYKKLMKQAFVLSTKNRKLSDEATSKANDIQKLMSELDPEK
ncbi:MAG: Lacal_2735 family protein [Flavobacteriales bacterium]|nr:Lacal_2735 family protein [Flavobacteriales bacterium]